MRKNRQIILFIGFIAIVSLSVLVVLFQNIINQTTLDSEQAITEIAMSTLIFEQTSIARFTAEPDNTNLTTPFYGQILYNEAVRQITATPTIDPSLPEPNCWLVADFWQLSNIEQDIHEDLLQSEIETTVEAFVSVVWNYDQCEEYLPVSNRIRVWINPDFDFETADIAPITETILETIVIRIQNSSDISPDISRIEFTIYFPISNQQLSVQTTLAEVEQAIQNGFVGEELLTAVGGIRE